MDRCAWGRANRVMFDAGKEENMVISTVDPLGGPAKLLGIEFDNKLVMATDVHKCATKAAWKTKALLRTRRCYSTVDVRMLDKSHVLSYIEYRTPSVHFASASVFKDLDDVQKWFLLQIGISKETALLDFNLVPLNVKKKTPCLDASIKLRIAKVSRDVVFLPASWAPDNVIYAKYILPYTSNP